MTHYNTDNEAACRLLTKIESRQELAPHYCEKLLDEIYGKRIIEDDDAALVIQALLTMEPDIDGWEDKAAVGGIVARRGWVKSLELMLEAGLGPNAIVTRQPSAGRSLLMEAAYNSSAMEATQLLINRGADLDQVDLNGETAIFMAAFGSNPGAVRMLLEAGASVLRVDMHGQSPLFGCFVSVEDADLDDVLSCAKQLLDAGVDPYLPSTGGELALQYAESYGGAISHGFRALMGEHSSRGLKGGTLTVAAKGSLPRM